jgi:hypothetical protein
MLSNIADNVWAFGLFLLAAGLAVTAHFGNDKDLYTFAGTVATMGAALFHVKPEKPAA